MSDNLDQALTSAGAAILFARENWTAFEAFCISQFGGCGIDRQTLNLHALLLTNLVDPERLAR